MPTSHEINKSIPSHILQNLKAHHLLQNKHVQKAVQLLAQLSLAALILMIFVGGTEPVAIELFPPPLDKIVHSLVYGLMLLLAILAFPNTRKPILFISTIMVGTLDEIHQIYLPGRSAGLDDLSADIFGCILISLILKYLDKK